MKFLYSQIKHCTPKWLKEALRMHQIRRKFKKSVIHPGAIIGSDCEIGESTVIFSNSSIQFASTIGNYSYVQSGTTLWNVEIGSFCSIASNVAIGLAGHPTFMVSTSPVFYDCTQPLPKSFTKEKIVSDIHPRTFIGSDVWIGQNVVAKAGIQINVGAVIGAGSVVTKDIPPYTIAAGNPCRPIRLRFQENICKRLLESKWWEYSTDKIAKLAPKFSDPEAFLTEVDLYK